MKGEPRRPAVAGSFYPADPKRLDSLVSELLEAAAGVKLADWTDPEAVRGLLVPHAGLVYSGAVAALGWVLAGSLRPKTIVLAGTDHQAWAAGVGVWTGGPWQTPLGEVAIDAALAAEIVALGGPFAQDDVCHVKEHSLEVQLPLLARTCPEAMIVPLAVSPRLRDHAGAGAALGRLLAEKRAHGERILVVASSDMAHYPPAAVCEATDAELLGPLLAMDPDGLRELEARIVREDRSGLVCGLCGIDPVRVVLTALTDMGAHRGILLRAATSADAGGDPRRTVGYAAAAFV